jgi:hypothetical protein
MNEPMTYMRREFLRDVLEPELVRHGRIYLMCPRSLTSSPEAGAECGWFDLVPIGETWTCPDHREAGVRP